MFTQDKRQPALGDDDLMPFGKHKGEPLQDVPARYLAWLWNDGLKDYSLNLSVADKAAQPEWVRAKIQLANHIWNSKDAIEQETGEPL